MGNETKEECIEKARKRYKYANRKRKKIILDEFCATWGYHRKYAIALLGKKKRKSKGKPGRPRKYDKEERKVLEKIWLVGCRPCAKRLLPMIAIWLPHYELTYGRIKDSTRKKLSEISKNSIDRLLAPTRKKYGSRGRCTTRPGTQLLDHIPIKTSHWDVTKPGFVQADTVGHGGSTTEGSFVYSLSFTDIFSGWTECRATWNKGAYGVFKQLERIEAILPFSILGFHCDNGSEFLTHHLFSYFTDRKRPVSFTRGRPRHGNDQAHVEQKNWTHVRLLLGYQRIDNPDMVMLINELYEAWSLFNNYFCTNLKLIEKKKKGSRYLKKYDDPKTPYQRLMESEFINEAQKTYMTEFYCNTNPFKLKKQIDYKQRKILNMLQ